MGLIYMRTSPSGKSYIGQTIRTEETRWKQHVRRANDINSEDYNSKLSRAIRKYGGENFSVKILEDNIPDELLGEKEKHYIKQYNTFGDNGYNLTHGGEGNLKFLTKDLLYLWQEKGYGYVKISQILCCSESTIRKRLKELIPPKEWLMQNHLSNNKIYKKEQLEIIAKAKRKVTQKRIKEQYKIGPKSLEYIFTLNNLNFRDYFKNTLKYDSSQIIPLYEKGLSLKEISEVVGINIKTVKSHLEKIYDEHMNGAHIVNDIKL